MNKAELVFKAIDVFGNLPQNAVRYSDVVRVQNIPYTEENERMNSGDLYFDGSILNDGKKHPILLYIHGGGFIKGDKDYRVTNSEYFAHHGYFVYNIDYRMPPQVSLIENFSDVITAFNYIEELAKDYNIDTSKIVVSGDSSGGYQTSMLAACAFDDELRNTLGLPGLNNRPAAIALMCGLYDMVQLVTGPRILGIVPETASMILGFKLKSDMSNYTDYEYINFISPVQLVNDKWCPTFMTWSKDDIICVGQGPSMAEQLEQHGITYDTFVATGFQNNHCFHLNMSFRIAQRCMSKCVHFLNTVLDHEDANDTYSEEEEQTEENGVAVTIKERAQKIEKLFKDKGIIKDKQNTADNSENEQEALE